MPEDPQLPEDIFTTTDKAPSANAPQTATVSAASPAAASQVQKSAPQPPPSPVVEKTFEKKPEPQNLDEAIAEADKEVRESVAEDTSGEPDIFMPPPKPSQTPSPSATAGVGDLGEKVEGSSHKMLIFVIVGVLLIGGGAAAGYYFFSENISSFFGGFGPKEEASPAEETTGDVMEEKTEEKEAEGAMEKKEVDTSSWLTYTNESVGIALHYPSSLSVSSDALPKRGEKGTANSYLLLESSDKSERLALWVVAEGLAAFTIPRGGELNPLIAATQFNLASKDGRFSVERVSYQGFSDVVTPDPSYIVAYTKDEVGGTRYVMLYTSAGDATLREETLKAIIASLVSFKVDSDGDGLFDDEEAKYGTDPKKADTDGDSFSDGVEVQNGYNPLGEGKLQ